MRTALFRVCRLLRSSLLVPSVLVTIALIAFAAGDEPEFPSAVFPRLALAQQALNLEKQGKYREALDSLQKLRDVDFVMPGHFEITGETEDGRFYGERVPPRPIGNRRLAMMRCQLKLGNQREGVALAWQTLEWGTADASAFACIAAHPQQQGGFDQTEKRLLALQKAKPKDRNLQRCLDYVKVERDLSEGDFAALVALIQSGASKRSSESGPRAELKEYVVAALLRRRDEAVPHLVKVLASSGQPTWIVYCLGLSKDRRAIEPLFKYLVSVENTWERNEASLALSRLGREAASHAVGKLTSDSPRVRERAAEVLSKCSAASLEAADPGLKQVFRALRDPQNRGAKPHIVNIPVFLLRAVAATRNRAYIPEVRRIKNEAESFGKFGDRQHIYTLGHLGDMSVVPDLIDGLDGVYSHFARPALEAATGKSFRTKQEWLDWWSKTGKKTNGAAGAERLKVRESKPNTRGGEEHMAVRLGRDGVLSRRFDG